MYLIFLSDISIEIYPMTLLGIKIGSRLVILVKIGEVEFALLYPGLAGIAEYDVVSWKQLLGGWKHIRQQGKDWFLSMAAQKKF